MANEFEDNFGGGFFGDGGDFVGGGGVGERGREDNRPDFVGSPSDDDDDFSIFDVGLFSLLGTVASIFAKSTPIGFGLSAGGRVLDAMLGTGKTVSGAFKDAFSRGEGVGGAGFFGENPDFFEGREAVGPDDSAGEGEPLIGARKKQRSARRGAPPSAATSLTTQSGTPQSRRADAFTGRRRQGTLFATETGLLTDTLGG